MLKTMVVTTEITPSRELRILFPDDTPLGPVEIVLVIASSTPHPSHTFADLLHSEFVGMWDDRTDITDSATFARDLRADAWRRAP